MSPEYHSGDYVLTSRLPLYLGRINVNSVLVFNSGKYGMLIKHVSAIDKKNKKFFFRGSSHLSLTTEKIGAIEEKNIIGYVIYHFKK